MLLELSKELRDALPEGVDPFDWFLHGSGEVHREIQNRLTYEARLGDHLHFYVKRHLGCGWGEVIKEWYRFRKPVVSARTEWEGAAILAAAGLRVPKVLGKGERGRYPHAIESFVVLDALEDCETLEYFKHGWMDFEGFRWVKLKGSLISEVASMCQTMHGCGINHRDFYINHFLINRDLIRDWQPGDELPLYLIDLHRVQHRSQVPHRWLVKDLASLLFSALDLGLTSADCGRYLRIYLGSDWKTSIGENTKLWQATIKRACKLYQGFHGKLPKLPAILKLR
jgi:heptose I phosphotransferase